MIFDLDNTSLAGNPIRIFDANGLEYHLSVWCDTKTGKIVLLNFDLDKRRFLVDPRTHEVIKETVFAAPPLSVILRSECLLPDTRLGIIFRNQEESHLRGIYKGCTCDGCGKESNCPVWEFHVRDQEEWNLMLEIKRNVYLAENEKEKNEP